MLLLVVYFYVCYSKEETLIRVVIITGKENKFMHMMRKNFSKAYWCILIFLLAMSIYLPTEDYAANTLTNNETISSFYHPVVFQPLRDPPRKDSRSFVTLRLIGFWFIAKYFSTLIIKPKIAILRFKPNSISIKKLKINLIPRYHNSMYESDHPYFLA